MTEYEIHAEIGAWLDTLDILWWHTPNEGRRGRVQALKLRKMGLRKGIPDIFAIRPDSVCIAAEVKRPGKKLTPEQADILGHLSSKGWYTDVVYSLNDMKNLYNKKTALTRQGMLYLASPYTASSKMEVERRVRAVKDTAYRLSQRGAMVYAPVLYGHSLELGEARTQSHKYWMEHCKAMLTGCKALMVCDHIQGHQQSRGIAIETAWAKEIGIPVLSYTELQ